MTTGIYKITNQINGHFYIGQSVKIENRFADHKIAAFNPNQSSYEYPLYRAIRKYGLENFKFEVIEECSSHLLNEREHYWIKVLKPEYNQTSGGDYQTHGKLTFDQVQEIQRILMEEKEEDFPCTVIAEMFSVHKDTIRAINRGLAWIDSDLTYPLRVSKYDCIRNTKQVYFCQRCQKEISKGSILCRECENKKRKEDGLTTRPVTREELKELIRNKSFLEIGRLYNVSDNAIRKWCKGFNLPFRKTDIKNISDQDWIDI